MATHHIVFEKPDISFLQQLAETFGIKVRISPDTKLEQEQFEKGIRTIRTQNGGEPIENAYVDTMLNVVETMQNPPQKFLCGLVVYLNDRFSLEIEEGPGAILYRAEQYHAQKSSEAQSHTRREAI